MKVETAAVRTERKHEEKISEPGMSAPVKATTNFVIGFMLLFGIYVVVYGHILPGEGFDGGLVIASTFVLCMLSYGREFAQKKMNPSTGVVIGATCGLILLALGLAGLRYGGVLFYNFLGEGEHHRLFSGGLVPVFNCIIGLMVCTSMYVIFASIVGYRMEKKRTREEETLEDG
jgi:multicomponent Na+:H+ antiporter subunit B